MFPPITYNPDCLKGPHCLHVRFRCRLHVPKRDKTHAAPWTPTVGSAGVSMSPVMIVPKLFSIFWYVLMVEDVQLAGVR